MAISEKGSTRLPRGTKPVAQAFLTALEAVAEGSQAAVAKAALAMIRDQLKVRREKQRATKATAKSRAPQRKARKSLEA